MKATLHDTEAAAHAAAMDLREAKALSEAASKRLTGAAESEEPSPWTEDKDGDPFLIEGHLYYRTITVNLPQEAGVTFRLANAGMGAGIPVLVHVHPATCRFAHVFQQSPEGVHPFLGRAERVEKPVKEGGAK